jgi:hypothetical protein
VFRAKCKIRFRLTAGCVSSRTLRVAEHFYETCLNRNKTGKRFHLKEKYALTEC